MKSDNGERRSLFLLFQLFQELQKSQKIKDDNGDEFVVIPSETVKKIIEMLNVIVNRMEGKLFADED